MPAAFAPRRKISPLPPTGCGVVRVAVRVAPRPVLPGDRQFLFEQLVERLEVGVVDRPVRADPVVGERREVRRVKAGGVAGVVHHRSADPAPGVVRAQRDRVGAADLARLGPVQGVRAAFVGDPVGVGVPERAGVQADDPPAGPGQPLGEHAAAGAGADDHQVDLVVVGVAAHVGAQPVVGARAVVGDQPRRVVAGPDVAVVASHAECPRSKSPVVLAAGLLDPAGERDRVDVGCPRCRGRRPPSARGRRRRG